MTDILKVKAVIKELGPLSSREVAEQLGISCSYARKLVSDLRKRNQCHIKEYRREAEGGRMYPRGLHVIGPGNDAKRPEPMTQTEYTQRHRQNKKTRYVNSVFALGVPIDSRRLTERKRPDVSERFKNGD